MFCLFEIRITILMELLQQAVAEIPFKMNGTVKIAFSVNGLHTLMPDKESDGR